MILDVKNLTHGFGDREIFDNVSFRLLKGEHIGLIGANEVPRIARQFGLDSSVKVNMMSVVHATTTAANLTRSLVRAR